MKKLATALCVGAALASSAAMAAQGDILARFRVVNVSPDVSVDKTLSVLKADLKDDTIPELDFTYMITNNIGAELILGTSRHKVTADRTPLGGGVGNIGKVSALPPTLTLQYHFAPDSASFRPYIGAGLNYTVFYNDGIKTEVGEAQTDRSSFGGALQLGADFPIAKNLFVNVDVKKIWMKTDVTGTTGKIKGAHLGTMEINPWVFGIGVGMKF